MEETLEPVVTRRTSTLRRKWLTLRRKAREMSMVAWGLAHKDHPILVHMIPIRRCNLSCTYCNEFDDHSPPVPTEDLFRRIDHLSKLGASILTLSGGEPMLHPDLDDIIRRIRKRGMIAGMLTNGYYLMPNRIQRLNEAGLDHLQISVDNVQPDDVSKKSLKVLDKKLAMLAEYADFHININSVLGADIHRPEDALEVAMRAQQYGLATTVGIIHDGSGQLHPLSPHQKDIFEQTRDLGKSSWGRINKYNPFQDHLVKGKANNWWWCRAGARYLYICEDGLVHYCSQQRGHPGIPLEQYTRKDIRREYMTEKGCAPYCTISCVHQVSIIDRWRDRQTLKFGEGGSDLIPKTTGSSNK